MAERPARHAPLTGIAAVVLWFVSLVIVEGLTNPPSENATPERALAYFNDEEVGIFISSFLFALGSLLFLWFVGSLRAALVAAEGGVARVANIAFAGVAFSLGGFVMPSTTRREANQRRTAAIPVSGAWRSARSAIAAV